MTLKVRILHILTIFTKVTTRLKNFLIGLIEFATVCIISWVILTTPTVRRIELGAQSMPMVAAGLWCRAVFW